MVYTHLLLAGILASMLHVISGPDHLAAVTPLAIESEKKAWKIGLSWGLGHLLGMLFIGLLLLVFKDLVPIERIAIYSEQLIGIVLISVGLWALYSVYRKHQSHKHPHFHLEDEPFIHIHHHKHDDDDKHKHSHPISATSKKLKQSLSSALGIGFIHGFSGIAHFLLLLPILGLESKLEGIQYILGFAIGTVLAMTTYAFLLGIISKLSKRIQGELFFNGIRLLGGIFAILIGVYWVICKK